MKGLLSCLLLSICVISSGKEIQENTTSNNPVSDDFKSYKLDIKADKVKITELIASVEFVRLEESKESLLPNPRQIFLHNDMIVFNTAKGDDIFFFDQQGNFLHKINRAGDGPEEYKRISQLWLEDNMISIYSWWLGTIKNYDLKGNFISSSRLPNDMAQMGHFMPYNDSYVLETNFSMLNDSSRYKLVMLDKNFKPIQKHLPFKPAIKNERHPHYPGALPMEPYHDGLLLLRSHSDTVYYLRGNELKPLIHFDYGDNWFWKGQEHITQDGFVEIETAPVPKAWEITADVGDKQIYTKAVMGISHWEHFLIDRQSGKSIHLDLRKDAENEYELIPLQWQGDEMLWSIASPDALELMENLSADKIKYRKGTSSEIISSSENPVLMWVTFKNNK